jgi:hypothetical protein
MQLGFNQFVSNNVIVNQQGIFHQWSLPDQQKFVTHNIIVNPNPYYCRTKDFFPNTGEIDSNVFWNNGAAVALVIDNGTSEISATPTWTQDKLDVHSVTADPQFVDPSKCNYQVKTTSPALGLGFKNFPMDQFGKPGYPACPGCLSAVTGVAPERAAAATTAQKSTVSIICGKNAFRFTLSRSAPVTFKVYSMNGRLCAQRTVAATKGENVVGWDALGKLPYGFYLVEMRMGEFGQSNIVMILPSVR